MGDASERINSASAFLLFRVGDAVRDAIERALSEWDLRGKDFRALALIADEPRSQRRLCQAAGLDRSTMVAVIDRLEHLGYAERTRNATDRRQQIITATARGEQILRTALTRLERVEEEFFAPLSEAQGRELNAALDLLFTTHDPMCATPRGADEPGL